MTNVNSAHVAHVAERARRCDGEHGRPTRAERRHPRFREQHAGVLARFDHGCRVGGVDAERLLAQHVLARGGRGFYPTPMHAVRQWYVDGLHVGPVDHRLVTPDIEMLEMSGHRSSGGSDGGELATRRRGQRRDDGLVRDPRARAQDADPQRTRFVHTDVAARSTVADPFAPARCAASSTLTTARLCDGGTASGSPSRR